MDSARRLVFLWYMYTYPLDSDLSGLGQVAQSWVKITLGQYNILIL